MESLNMTWNRVLNRENDNSITNTDDSILKDMNEIMSDDEIVENILQINEQQEMQEDETYIDVENDTEPSHDVAFHALETALKWFEKQTGSDTLSLLQLKRIRDIAAMKRNRNKNLYLCLYTYVFAVVIKLVVYIKINSIIEMSRQLETLLKTCLQTSYLVKDQ
ncbi:hypothetical protein HHI36_007652 [Cryptolaemus montrouzieri]|uniref:Uncharacterized protein n=1 Tax=Cryptolaemus montrouzieri TaxID=559131 RepID=A0ABD2MQC9_9CUCU